MQVGECGDAAGLSARLSGVGLMQCGEYDHSHSSQRRRLRADRPNMIDVPSIKTLMHVF